MGPEERRRVSFPYFRTPYVLGLVGVGSVDAEKNNRVCVALEGMSFGKKAGWFVQNSKRGMNYLLT